MVAFVLASGPDPSRKDAMPGKENRDRRLMSSPTRIRAALRQANVLRRTGRLVEARALYLEILSAQHDQREALKRGAIVSFQLDESREAVTLLRRAIALDDTDAGAHNDLGNILHALGHLEDAIASYHRAVALEPEKAETQFNLGNALRATGAADSAVAAYEKAIDLRPDYLSAMLQIGLVHHATGDPVAAATMFRRVINKDPKNAEANFALANTLYATGQLDQAIAAYDEAARLRSDILDASFELGKPRHVHAHFDRGDSSAALAACDAFLARKPGQSGALAMKVIALNELNRQDEARNLLGFDRFLRQVRPEPPRDLPSISALNETLARHVYDHPTLMDAPESYSMERGQNTGELFVSSDGPAAQFLAMVEKAVAGYRDTLPRDPSHPFLAAIPQRFRATAWGVILDGGAYQVPHIHPSAWLSGGYYVRLPTVVEIDDPGHAGWSEFGRPYWDFHTHAEPETRLIKPEEGLMLLFPSYAFHRTVPFAGDEHRISIAFDILCDD